MASHYTINPYNLQAFSFKLALNLRSIAMKIQTCLIAALAFVGFTSYAADHSVDQKNKQFSKKTLTIKVGDTVEFTNSDPFAHNVFSLSDAKSFDLGSYPQGQSKKVKFDKEGTVEVECSIHPAMQMTIEVSK
jgi:plastocyanin